MKLIKQSIEKDGSGSITLLPERPEDMVTHPPPHSSHPFFADANKLTSPQWHAFNLIRPTDLLRAPAIRRVTATESDYSSNDSKRVSTILTIRVKSIDFDSQVGQLHVSGTVAEENPYVGTGQHHTLDLELQRQFTLEKSVGWDSVSLDIVREALRQDTEDTIPAVVMQDGMANICLITENQTVLKQRVEMSIPRKRQGATGDQDKGLNRFYQTTLETLTRHVDIAQPRPILLASPGFTAAGFLKYIIDEATRTANKAVLSNKNNFLLLHSSSGHLHSLNEVLKSKEVLAKLKDTKYARETGLMDDFFAMLRKDDGRAWYGPREVEKAVENGAVGRGGGVLLINNMLFRSQDIETRRRWVEVVDKAKEDGGEVRILSSEHESGTRLEGLGGIAAILTYPLEDLDEEEGESGSIETV
jgi:protein pelota